MTRYWLHLLKPERTSASFTVALSRSPHDNATFGSALPTRTFNSWEQLATALLAAGIPPSDLNKAQHDLQGEGLHTFADIALTDDQRAVLGFGARGGSSRG